MNEASKREPSGVDLERRLLAAPQLDSTLSCPFCGHTQLLRMPTDACLWFHECERCRNVLRPKAGDCCVFCSYGSVPCPPVQVSGGQRSGCC